MQWLDLPKPQAKTPPAFSDPLTGKIWLADLPSTQPLPLVMAITHQILAIDAANLPAAKAIELLNFLRAQAIAPQAALEPVYLRKALPLGESEKRTFEAAEMLWYSMALAYLRRAMEMPPAEQGPALQKAAIALRQTEFCYFQAARDLPAETGPLLFAVLGLAHAGGTLFQPIRDPEYPHFAESNIAGHVAWAFLMRLCDPYQLTPVQLLVANRALSRWRELCEFRSTPSPDPKGHSVDISFIFGDTSLPPGVPKWMEIRKVSHKIASRIKSLEAGETPEALRLGRELSGAACIRLLHLLDISLEAQYRPAATEIGDIELAFGAEHAYQVLKGESLKKVQRFDATASQISHQRLEIFGFDKISHVPDGVRKLDVPSETWSLVDGVAMRLHDVEGARRQSPCLISTKRKDKTRLGVMRALRIDDAGNLNAELDWYVERIEAGYISSKGNAQDAIRHAVFLLRDGDHMTLIAPTEAIVRLNDALFLTGIAIGRVVIDGVIERGVDFVHYSVRTR